MKLLILCNDRLALPALNQLIQLKLVAGVGMIARQGEIQSVVSMMCSRSGVPLKLFQKNNFENDLQGWVLNLNPDAVWVKTFPWKIPDMILNKPRFGFINFHYAPLPEYRGANPLFWMIKDGITEAGVSVHQMTAEMDEGPILLQSKIPIHSTTTFGMLISRLGFSGVELSSKLLQLMQGGKLKGTPQIKEKSAWYNRPQPKDLWIDWNTMDAAAISRLVNACNPWNKGAPAKLDNWMVGLTYVTALDNLQSNHKPGMIFNIDEVNGLKIACQGNTAIRVDVVFTEEGFMPGHALQGFGIQQGMQFS